MLNHGWVLLTNLARSDNRPVHAWDEAGDVYVPPVIPASIKAVRQVLFGLAPDTAMSCWRARQLLTALHGSPLQTYLDLLDPRRTYDASDWRMNTLTGLGVHVSREAGEDPSGIAVFGNPLDPDGDGLVERQYVLTQQGEGFVDAVSIRPTIQNLPQIAFDPAHLPSDPQPLGLTGLRVRFLADEAGARFSITTAARPRRSLIDLIESVARLGDAAVQSLFGATEPYSTFQAGWRSNDYLTRGAALTIALIYRMNELLG